MELGSEEHFDEVMEDIVKFAMKTNELMIQAMKGEVPHILKLAIAQLMFQDNIDLYLKENRKHTKEALGFAKKIHKEIITKSVQVKKIHKDDLEDEFDL